MSIALHFPLRSAFLALPLEGDSKRQFQALQDALKPYARILRFQDPKSPHLTLQFWREVMEIEYRPIVKKVEEMAARTSPFTLQVIGTETFQSHGENRVLFLTIAFSPELATLKKLCPWFHEEHGFQPHITLARIAHPQRFARAQKKILKELDGASFPITVDRLRLYGDVDGRKQTVIGEFVFGGHE